MLAINFPGDPAAREANLALVFLSRFASSFGETIPRFACPGRDGISRIRRFPRWQKRERRADSHCQIARSSSSSRAPHPAGFSLVRARARARAPRRLSSRFFTTIIPFLTARKRKPCPPLLSPVPDRSLPARSLQLLPSAFRKVFTSSRDAIVIIVSFARVCNGGRFERDDVRRSFRYRRNSI